MLPINFIGRKRELMFLNDVWKSDKFELVVIYGIRRIGKTELIKQFIEKKSSLYFLSSEESFQENLKGFKMKLSEFLKKKYIKDLNAENFYYLFSLIKDELKGKKFIIVLDEFQYLLKANPAVLSDLQKVIDEILIKTKIKLILLGSSIGIFTNDVLNYRSPLYGRNLKKWKLTPLAFFEVMDLFKSFKDALEYYFIFGGIPYYLVNYDFTKSLLNNLVDLVLKKGALFYDEPEILLKQELREARVYKLILKYLAIRSVELGKLASFTGLDKFNLSKYLVTLEELDLIDHILPFGFKKRGIYRIKHEFMNFWFRFVYPYKNDLELYNYKKIISRIEQDLNDYFGYQFEFFIMTLLKYEFDVVSKWWHKDKEIDIVAMNEAKNELLFAECKWKSNVNAKQVLKELKEKTKFVKWNNENRKEKYIIFAKSFKVKTDEAECIDLKELEKMIKKIQN